MSVDVVKLQSRALRPKGTQYLVTVPNKIVKELGWNKGEILIVRAMELEIDGIKRKVLVYYKP